MPLKGLGWRTIVLTVLLFVVFTLPSFQSGWSPLGDYVAIGWPWTWFEKIYTPQGMVESLLTLNWLSEEDKMILGGTHFLWWRLLLLTPLYAAGGIILATFYTYVLLPSVRGCRRSPAWRLLLCSMYGIILCTSAWTLDTFGWPFGWPSAETPALLIIAIVLVCVSLPSLATALTVYRCASYPLSASAGALLYGSLIWSLLVYPIFVKVSWRLRFPCDWEEMGKVSAILLPIFLIPSLVLTMIRRARLRRHSKANSGAPAEG